MTPLLVPTGLIQDAAEPGKRPHMKWLRRFMDGHALVMEPASPWAGDEMVLSFDKNAGELYSRYAPRTKPRVDLWRVGLSAIQSKGSAPVVHRRARDLFRELVSSRMGVLMASTVCWTDHRYTSSLVPLFEAYLALEDEMKSMGACAICAEREVDVWSARGNVVPGLARAASGGQDAAQSPAEVREHLRRAVDLWGGLDRQGLESGMRRELRRRGLLDAVLGELIERASDEAIDRAAWLAVSASPLALQHALAAPWG